MPPTDRPLPPADLQEQVQRALAEDVGTGDVTAALVPAPAVSRALVITREAAILCGQPWFNAVFAALDPQVRIDWQVTEGASVGANATLCEIRGPSRAILTGERTALNF